MIKLVFSYLLIVVWCCILTRVLGQNLAVPHIACPQYFEYLCYGSVCIGKITLPIVQSSTTIVEVEFTQRAPVAMDYYGKLSLFDDKETTINNISRGRPISYRIDFPLPTELPKLTALSVNGRTICTASSYSPPSTTVNLEHKLVTSVTPAYPQRPISMRPRPVFIDEDDDDDFSPIQQRPRPRPRPVPVEPTVIVPKLEPSPPVQLPVRPPVQPPVQPPVEPPVSSNVNDVCGQEGKEPIIVQYISGGEFVRPGQYPWLTAIYHKTVGRTTFICGGSLISARTVLSAAHCFQLTNMKAEDTSVYLGRHNLSSSMETSAVARDIQSIHISTEFVAASYQDADVALLIMVEPVSFSKFIKPICLWTGADDFNLIVNLTGYVAGWGGDSSGNAISAVPKVTPANIVSESACRSSSDLFKTLLTSRTFCAGQQDGNAPCMGDSGGGLMIERNGRWYLRGVVSAGSSINQRCNPLTYVVYCDVAKHLSWVRSQLV